MAWLNPPGCKFMPNMYYRAIIYMYSSFQNQRTPLLSCMIDTTRRIPFTCLVLLCLVHPGVRDKRQVSEIDLSQPRHETAFWWRHNGPVTSQLTDPIMWHNYPLRLIGIAVYIHPHTKESLTQICRRSTNVQLCLILVYISIWFESQWMACFI